MAISNPRPIVINGLTYPLLGVSLAMSTIAHQDQMKLSIAATFTPYRDTESGPDVLEDGKVVLVYSDAFAQATQDPALAKFLGILVTAAQEFINERI